MICMNVLTIVNLLKKRMWQNVIINVKIDSASIHFILKKPVSVELVE